jgi:SAM-dependent methyltransferase
MSSPDRVPPYHALASGYDVVMEHVDYEGWADYVLELVERHHPGARTVLDLGCGTGTLAIDLAPRGSFAYVASDGSEAMVRIAAEKAALAGADAGFAVLDFRDFDLGHRFDVVLLLYDGMNYLLEEAELAQMLGAVARHLAPEGIFVMDQSTPANSINNEAYFGDAGTAEAFSFVRQSRYDRETRLHTTDFELIIEGERYLEQHVQRAYTVDEVRRLIAGSPLVELAAYDGFTMEPASDASERIHWVCGASE